MNNWGGTYRYAEPEDCPPLLGDERMPVQCPYCGTHSDAEIKERFETGPNKYINLPHPKMQIHNFFLRCTKCQSAILVLWTYGYDDLDLSNTRAVTAGSIVYPFPSEASNMKEYGESVPAAIVEDMKQAELAYYAKAFMGAGVLLRRACQNICRNKGCSENKGLKSQLKELAEKGVITTDLATIAEAIRIIGNEIAHPSPDEPFIISPKDVKAAYEFMKQLIQIIYINPYRAKLLIGELEERGVSTK